MDTQHEVREDPLQDRKAELAEAARLFNRLGYTTASLDLVERALRDRWNSDVPWSCGEQLAQAAFDFAASASDRLLQDAVDGEETGTGKLEALVRAFRRSVEDPPAEGGSPALYAATPSSEALPFLETRARTVVDGWRHRVRRIVRLGIRRGEFRPSARPEQVASIVVGTMEGAMFLHRLYRDASHLDCSLAYLNRYLEAEVLA